MEDRNNKKQAVQVNWLKQAYNSDAWKPKAKKNQEETPTETTDTQTRQKTTKLKLVPFRYYRRPANKMELNL
jgi:hypothetical protein